MRPIINFSIRQQFKYLFITVLILNLSNCAVQIEDADQSNEKSSVEEAKLDSKRDLSGKTIGYCTPSLNAPYYQALLASIKQTTEKNGMTFLSADGQDDITKQIAAVEDLITKGVDALLLNPKDPDALVEVTRSAKAAGIPVFIIDSSISPSADYVTTIQSNNLANGEGE